MKSMIRRAGSSIFDGQVILIEIKAVKWEVK